MGDDLLQKKDNPEDTCFELQIIILKWFLKDHVTLKTGVMMLKNQLWHHREKIAF